MENTEKQIFSDFIARKGLRATSQRELVLDEFCVRKGTYQRKCYTT